MTLASFALAATTVLSAQTVAHTGGCARQVPDVQVSDAGDLLTVGLQRDGMQITSGGTSSCTLLLSVQVPDNRSFAISRVTAHGLVNLIDPVESATLAFDWLFPRSAAGAATIAVTGPSQGIFSATQDVAPEAIAWSACGGEQTLQLRTQIASDELFTVDPNTMRMTLGYGLVWKDCSP